MDLKNPLIVQSDHTISAEANNPAYPTVRDLLLQFAELTKSPEYLHTYKITPLSIWNAASAGMSVQEMTGVLHQYSKYPVPLNVLSELEHLYARFGKIELLPGSSSDPLKDPLILKVSDALLAEQIKKNPKTMILAQPWAEEGVFQVEQRNRGKIKQVLIKMGWPVVDLVGYVSGGYFPLALREITLTQKKFTVRDYQEEAANTFYQGGAAQGGSGVIVLPCGSGKTIVGILAMMRCQCRTLIICTSVAAVHQWIREILDKTNISAADVGEYTGEKKDIRPITVATYNILTYRNKNLNEFEHFDLFNINDWGLVIYDEVHLLPAPLFSITANIQARRRLGLTATLIREDGKEDEVFSLIGPKKYDVPWKDMESQGWIAEAVCCEVRVPMNPLKARDYAEADWRVKFKVASSNSWKTQVIRHLLQKHQGEPTLIIGQYLEQLKVLTEELKCPLITGQTPNRRRETLYQEFREGKRTVLIVSKVANFSIDIPEAKVLIQISGMFGSRQEEAQRLGRILRPKEGKPVSYFYSLITADTVEQEFSHHRQLFLTEQGYRYQIEDFVVSTKAAKPLEVAAC